MWAWRSLSVSAGLLAVSCSQQVALCGCTVNCPVACLMQRDFQLCPSSGEGWAFLSPALRPMKALMLCKHLCWLFYHTGRSSAYA